MIKTIAVSSTMPATVQPTINPTSAFPETDRSLIEGLKSSEIFWEGEKSKDGENFDVINSNEDNGVGESEGDPGVSKGDIGGVA